MRCAAMPAAASGNNLLAVWHQVIAQKEITDNGPDMDSPEYEVALARLNQLQDEIANAPAQSCAGHGDQDTER